MNEEIRSRLLDLEEALIACTENLGLSPPRVHHTTAPGGGPAVMVTWFQRDRVFQVVAPLLYPKVYYRLKVGKRGCEARIDRQSAPNLIRLGTDWLLSGEELVILPSWTAPLKSEELPP